jgi:malate dehydrogenase
MFRSALRSLKVSPQISLGCARQFHGSNSRHNKVTVIGAAGGIGQPLSLLLKYNPLVTHLNLYDVAPMTPGVAADIGHINTGGACEGFAKEQEEMDKALKDADLVIVPAGVPRQPGMTRDDLFNINGGIVKGIAEACSRNCPNAFLLIISNPVNSTVPIFKETLKALGTYDSRRLFGVTALDVCRANTFVAENQDWQVENVKVDVIGGHAGITIIPLLSQVENSKFSDDDIKNLSKRIAFGGDEVVQAKAGSGSATLSMAHAGAVFANQVLRAANGEEGIVECAYVDSNLIPEAGFFASPVKLGVNGVEEVLPLPELSDFEKAALAEMLPQLSGEIAKGVDFCQKEE